MAKLRQVEVFTPSDFPKYTYVARDSEQLEKRLRDALATPGEIVSVSGPSKSGKTVLVEKVVGADNLIAITGAGVRDPDHLWDRVLDWMDVPQSTTSTSAIGGTGKISASATGGVSLARVAKGEIATAVEGSMTGTHQRANSRARRGLAQVVSEMKDSDFVLLIDDYHYMDRAVQSEVAKQIKEAARLHVKICVVSVPHRADDVVRGNPELRGRVRAIDLNYWQPKELKYIAEIGFPLLELSVDSKTVDRFVREASGSPQLMQAMCLQCCFDTCIRQGLGGAANAVLEDSTVTAILEETATRTDFSSLVRNMHTGPKTRGTERKEFLLHDNTRGDVYRCVLMAIALDPPRLDFTYKELSRRIQIVSAHETPQAASIYQACAQIGKMALDMYPGQRVVEWDEDDSLLDIVDPYFLFYVRWSGKLSALGFTHCELIA